MAGRITRRQPWPADPADAQAVAEAFRDVVRALPSDLGETLGSAVATYAQELAEARKWTTPGSSGEARRRNAADACADLRTMLQDAGVWPA